MHIFVTGGTGLIGSALIFKLSAQGHRITVLTRNVVKARQKLGDRISFCSTLKEIETFDDYDAVINLAGEPIIGKRWSVNQKERLCNSRWMITRHLTELIKNSANPPKVFISGSAVGYYGAQGDSLLKEDAEPHDEFTHRLCKQWEYLALEAQSVQTRVCILRTGIVLSKEGGMLPSMLLPFRLGLGAILGKGNQYVSWIHIDDMIKAIVFLLDMPEAQGVFNITAPNPVTNKRFANVLSTTLYRPRLFRIPSFLLKMVLGEMASMIIDGQRVIPRHLLDLHFRFTFEHFDKSIENILKD